MSLKFLRKKLPSAKNALNFLSKQIHILLKNIKPSKD